MKVVNQTSLKKAEEFLKRKMSGYTTVNLEVTMKEMPFPKSKAGQASRGFCKYPFVKTKRMKLGNMKAGYYAWKKGTFRITTAIDINLAYPYEERMPVATRQLAVDFEWIYDKEMLRNAEENMVWILGHEVWHYLCKTKQEKGNYQTKSNANGYKWLREFKQEES